MQTALIDKSLNNILNEVIVNVKDLYGDKLKEVVLYGSYSRGQQDDESDIDLLLLIDVDDVQLKQYVKKLNSIISDIGYRHQKMLSMIDISYDRFNTWSDVVPFYRSLKNEGVVIYEQ